MLRPKPDRRTFVMAKGGNKRDFGEHATKGENKHALGEYATNGANKREFGEHATKSGYYYIYKRDFSWKQPFLLRIPHAPPSLAISGSHENVLKCKVFRVQKPVLLPISFRPSTHSPKTARTVYT